jgi:hypothetical protein
MFLLRLCRKLFGKAALVQNKDRIKKLIFKLYNLIIISKHMFEMKVIKSPINSRRLCGKIKGAREAVEGTASPEN